MITKEKALSYIGTKLLDRIFDGSIDAILEEKNENKILTEYEKIKNVIKNNLLEGTLNESYFESIQSLINESRIIDLIFNMSYMFCELANEERENCINTYVDDYYKGKCISKTDISIIKGKIIQQYTFCFSNINRPDDKTRKIINQLSLQIANDKNEQQKAICSLKCDLEDFTKVLEEIVLMLSCNNVDLEYLHEVVGVSLENLKGRFSRDFNVDVELTDSLNIFCNTDINKKNLFTLIHKLKSAVQQNKLSENKELLQRINFLIDQIKNEKAFEYDFFMEEIKRFISDTQSVLQSKYEINTEGYYQTNEYYYWRQLCSVNDELDEYRRMMLSDVLIITGEAGVGKSHSIAQFINSMYYVPNKPCVFLLGQHLNENLDPIIMIEKYLHLPYTLQNFLNELNTIAVSKNIEIPFIIEGINEGFNSQIWKDYFAGLVCVFSKYCKIKLVISIRKTYIDKCLPEGYNKQDKTVVIEHRGFENNSLDAITAFFEYYGISMPTFPILYSDFSNPLFLHTLCKTLQGSNIVLEEYSSFTEVFTNYIKVVENSVSKICNYRENLKLVHKVVHEVIKYSLDNNARYGIEINEFYIIVGKVVVVYGVSQIDFVQAMIESGLFYAELYGYDEEREYVQFAYERYHNIVAAQYILNSIESIEDLHDSISNGNIKKCFDDHQDGIVEELFVLIPQKYKVEFLDLLSEENALRGLDSYLNSLVWRKGANINFECTRKLINKYVIVREWYFREFLKKLIIIAPVENHPFNAIALHEYLLQYSMANRDSFWNRVVVDEVQYSGVLNNLLNLSKHQKKMYSKETKYLILVLLGWTLACTQNIYRENAIRAMVGLLQNELDLVVRLLKCFEDVNDGYVKEGVYCVAYGAILRAQDFSFAEELGETVYEDIFERDEVYPHIIVRAHAKGILDYLSYKNVKVNKDLSKIVPPYNSGWYEAIPTDEEIEAFTFGYKDCKVTSEMYCVNKIISSMATNTGKHAGGYGDFGRYIFEGWVEPWEYHFIPQELSNIVVKIIMEQYGYDYKKHGSFDSRVSYYDRHNHTCERIGKKYQRIASFEMLAKLADNFEPGKVETVYSEAYSKILHNRFERFLKGGMQGLYGDEEDNGIDKEEGEDEYEESEDDVKTVFIPFRYEGPWQFDYRGIDPSVLAEPTKKEKNFWGNIWKIPEVPLNEWACEESLEPELDKILFVQYDGEEFVSLEMYNKWKSEEKILGEESMEYFIKAIAALVPDEYEVSLKEKNLVKGFAEGGCYSEPYTIFGREFFWSEAYRNYEKLCQEEYDETDDKEDEVIPTGINYHCPLSYSEQVENVLSSYSLPSKFLVDVLHLEQLEDGKWFNQDGDLIAVDIAVDGFHTALLVRKSALINLMTEKRLKLAWGIYTEKEEQKKHCVARKIAQWKGDELKVEQYQKEKWSHM